MKDFKMRKKYFTCIVLCLFASSVTLVSGCSTPKTYQLPAQEEFQGYTIIDGVDKQSISVDVDKDEKIAIAVRDITTTSYSYLEPRYMNSMVNYEGKSQCCLPTSILMGNSGLTVYKFSFIGKGKTTIKLVARQKGLSTVANNFDNDHVINVLVDVD